MKLNTLFFFILAILLFSCQEQHNGTELLIDESTISQIENLKSDQEKSDFLHKLWKEDQGTRNRKGQGSEIIAKYGYHSEEHQAYNRELWKINQRIFLTLKIYLEQHDYPVHPENYHELAINAFPIIIGHHHNFEQQKELLPYLYKAYQKGNCSLEDVVWVLGEMHESKYKGERYEMKTNRYTTEQEFNALNEVLNLDLN